MLILFEQIYFIIYLGKIITTRPILSIVKRTLVKYLFEQLAQYDIIVKTKIKKQKVDKSQQI